MFQADLKALWIMPVMQLGLFIFFTLDAWLHFWMNWWLLMLCLFTGSHQGAFIYSKISIKLEQLPIYLHF